MNILKAFRSGLDRINKIIGHSMAHFILLMVLIQFTMVVVRYVFQTGSIFGYPVGYYNSAVMYLHGFSFMLGSAYSLQCNEHVRVDIFYNQFSCKKRAIVNVLGTLFLLFPFCMVLIKVSWKPMLQSWASFEGSMDIGQTLPLEYLRKSLPVAFATLMFIQGIAVFLKGVLVFLGLEDYKNIDRVSFEKSESKN